MAILGSPPSKWKINADGDIQPRKSTANLRIENDFPKLIIRETDQSLPNGLWRTTLEGNALKIEQNTAIAGDFGTVELRLVINDGSIVGHGRLTITGGPTAAMITLDTAEDVGDIDAGALFRSSDDDRIHWKDVDNADHVIAYTDEIGNTVLVSEYIVNETPIGDVDGMNTDFALVNTPEAGTLQVYLNGMLQDPGMTNDYTISGSTVTFNSAPLTGDKVRAGYIKS